MPESRLRKPGYRQTYPGGLRWTGSELAWVGANPPAGARIIVRAGTAAGVTSAGSSLTVNYDSPFPNGIVSLVVTPGDNANSLGFLQVPLSGQTLSLFTCFAWRAGATTSIAGLPVRVNYVAMGW